MSPHLTKTNKTPKLIIIVRVSIHYFFLPPLSFIVTDFFFFPTKHQAKGLVLSTHSTTEFCFALLCFLLCGTRNGKLNLGRHKCSTTELYHQLFKNHFMQYLSAIHIIKSICTHFSVEVLFLNFIHIYPLYVIHISS